ncbi:dihydrofolate reductase [Vibrio phage D51]
MNIVAIFATTEKGQFGIDGGLPWGRSAPDDLQFFKDMTMGNAIIMGSATLASVSHLQGRDKIVITSQAHCTVSNNASTYFVGSMDAALELATTLGHSEAYIIGGARVLRENAHLADEVLWSRIPGNYPADIYLDVEKITKDRALLGSAKLADGTTVFNFGKLVSSTDPQKTALEEALDREQKTTFGNIPIKENLEYEPSEAVENAMDITKQMIRGQS